MAIEIYCVKCKAKTDLTNVESVTMKNGRPATKALCAVCGAGKYRIGRDASGDELSQNAPAAIK